MTQFLSPTHPEWARMWEWLCDIAGHYTDVKPGLQRVLAVHGHVLAGPLVNRFTLSNPGTRARVSTP